MTVLNYSRGRYAQSYTPTLKHADPKQKMEDMEMTVPTHFSDTTKGEKESKRKRAAHGGDQTFKNWVLQICTIF